MTPLTIRRRVTEKTTRPALLFNHFVVLVQPLFLRRIISLMVTLLAVIRVGVTIAAKRKELGFVLMNLFPARRVRHWHPMAVVAKLFAVMAEVTTF